MDKFTATIEVSKYLHADILVISCIQTCAYFETAATCCNQTHRVNIVIRFELDVILSNVKRLKLLKPSKEAQAFELAA